MSGLWWQLQYGVKYLCKASEAGTPIGSTVTQMRVYGNLHLGPTQWSLWQLQYSPPHCPLCWVCITVPLLHDVLISWHQLSYVLPSVPHTVTRPYTSSGHQSSQATHCGKFVWGFCRQRWLGWQFILLQVGLAVGEREAMKLAQHKNFNSHCSPCSFQAANGAEHVWKCMLQLYCTHLGMVHCKQSPLLYHGGRCVCYSDTCFHMWLRLRHRSHPGAYHGDSDVYMAHSAGDRSGQGCSDGQWDSGHHRRILWAKIKVSELNFQVFSHPVMHYKVQWSGEAHLWPSALRIFMKNSKEIVTRPLICIFYLHDACKFKP